MKKKNISEAATEEEEEIMEEEEDPFNRLPNELIVLIFSKIAEAKSLCWVSLICTRFSFLILETKVVIVKIAASKNPPNNQSLPQKLFNFLTKPLYRRFFLSPQSSFVVTANPNLQAVANFLSKFKYLQVLIVQAPDTNNDNNSILKWVAHFKPSGINRFVILFAEKETSGSGYPKYMQLAHDQFMDILMGYHGLWFMLTSNPNLTVQGAVITNTETSGRIYVDQAQIVEMKNSQPKISCSLNFSLWNVPLPASYHEFKAAKIASFNTPVLGEEPNEAENRNILEAWEDIQTKF